MVAERVPIGFLEMHQERAPLVVCLFHVVEALVQLAQAKVGQRERTRGDILALASFRSFREQPLRVRCFPGETKAKFGVPPMSGKLAQRFHRFVRSGTGQIGQAQCQQRQPRVRLQVKHLSADGDSLLVSTPNEVDERFGGCCVGVEGVEFPRTSDLSEGLIPASHVAQESGEVGIRVNVDGVELERSSELLLGVVPPPLEPKSDLCKHMVRLRQAILERQGAVGCDGTGLVSGW